MTFGYINQDPKALLHEVLQLFLVTLDPENYDLIII